ncbi:MAG TPA: hypothetical protein VHP33_28800 [Polyangiaceae bacterium]|nr:hypothetical protein [Polyangiaceae bacterium]
MKTTRHAGFAVMLVALGALSLGAGCGMSPKAEAPSSGSEAAPVMAAPTSNQAPAEESEAEPATLADAEALLEKARADLDRLALNEQGAPGRAAAGAAAPSPAPSPPPATATAPRDLKRAEKSSAADEAAAPAAPPAPAKEPNACETACKAFSSLTRASDAVCRLDTDGGKRCERARQIRADASQRVASCGCTK